MKIIKINNTDMMPLFAGTLTQGVAHELLVFCKIFNDLPKIAAIGERAGTIARIRRDL